MDLPRPPQALAALARFLRSVLRDHREDGSVVGTARQLATVVVGAAAPFAQTSYSRARLIRQMHACGLLTDEHLARTQRLLEIGAGANDDGTGAPR